VTIAYHFVGATLRDGRPVPPDGEWLVHDGQVEICRSGLHASEDPFDALQYATGSVLCMVECKRIVDRHPDKLVCRRRRIIKRFDATDLLRAYARWAALQAIHLWDAPAVVREYLETGDEGKLAASRDAAWDAAWDASRDASARDASRASARDAARDVARDTQRTEFRRMVDEEFAKLEEA
jgi:hypothetical protein